MLLGVSYASGNKTSDNKTKAKARYYYLKGATSSAEENYDQAYEFYKKAIQTDPGYIEAGFDFGVHRLVLLEDTFSTNAEIGKSLSFMRGLIDAYPNDLVAGESYAYYAMEADTLEEALRVYNILIKEHPGVSRLYYPQSLLYLQLGQPDSAVNAIREFERLEGATSETMVRKISYILTKGDTIAALKEVSDYAAANPGNPRVVLDEAMIYNAMALPDSSISILERGLKEFPDNGDMQFDLGFLYLEQGDTAKFHSLVARALTSDHFEYEDRIEGLRIYLSKLPARDYDYKESDNLVKQLNERYPNDVALINLTADYHFMKGDKDGAYALVKKAYSLEPDDSNLLGRLISYSIVLDKPKEGMAAYEAYPNDKDKYMFSLAMAYVAAAEQVKEYDKAVKTLENLLQATIPDLSLSKTLNKEATDSLAAIYLPADITVASATYEVAGDLFGRMNRQEDAVRSYENALAFPADNASVMNNYAYYLVETINVAPGTPEFEKAKKMSFESIQKTQESPEANYYDTYAWILFKEKNYKEALQYIEMSVELEGDNPPSEILSHYGDILFMNGKADEALDQWKRALEADPTDASLKKKVEQKTLLDE